MSTFDSRRRPKNKTRAAAQKAASDTIDRSKKRLIDSNIVQISASISDHKHINEVVKKGNKIIAYIRSIIDDQDDLNRVYYGDILWKSLGMPVVNYACSTWVPSSLRAVFYKNHPGHGDQGWINLSKLGPYTSIDEPLSMAMEIPASVAPVFLDEICLISLI